MQRGGTLYDELCSLATYELIMGLTSSQRRNTSVSILRHLQIARLSRSNNLVLVVSPKLTLYHRRSERLVEDK